MLDAGLPVMDGAQVALGLRQQCGAGLPILVVTANGRAAEKARLAGAFAYLHKPCADEALIAAVRRGLAMPQP